MSLPVNEDTCRNELEIAKRYALDVAANQSERAASRKCFSFFLFLFSFSFFQFHRCTTKGFIVYVRVASCPEYYTCNNRKRVVLSESRGVRDCVRFSFIIIIAR